MKFNVVIGNPPFFGTSATHQKMFNLCFKLLEKGGKICFIQPATTYFNKKKFSKKAEQEMYNLVEKYKTSVYILPPTIFKGVVIQNYISITLLEKTEHNFGKVDKIHYQKGYVYKNVELKNISITGIDPKIYGSIRKKYMALVEKNGSIFNISIKDENSKKSAVKICSIRGGFVKNGISANFFTFISRTEFEVLSGTKHGVLCEESEYNNLQSYLMTNFARFALTFLKLNPNMHRGEIKLVPILSWSKKWKDEELFSLIGLTKKEIKIINDFIPYWNHSGK